MISTSCTKEAEIIIQHKLTVSANPSVGGTVTPGNNSYNKGQIVNLLATPSAEYVFRDWSGSLSGSTNPSPVTMDIDKSVVGNFEKRQYPLSLTIEGQGTVKEEIAKVATLSQYPSGTTVRLTATPLEKYEFGGWSGDLISSNNPIEVKIEKAISLKVLFNLKKLTSCDSLISGLLKNRSDTIRLLSCIKVSSCDSIRLGVLKLKNQKDSLRYLSCIKVSSCDSIRLGILKLKNQKDSLRYLNCIKISKCDSLKLGVLKLKNPKDSLRYLSCIKISGCDSLRLGILKPNKSDSLRLPCILSVGKVYGGGEVFYLDATGKHGMVVSELLQWIEWGEEIETGATSTSDGFSNTMKILEVYKNSKIPSAAKIANSYRGGGFTNWYLPSKDELQLMYDYTFYIKKSSEQASALWTSTEIPPCNLLESSKKIKCVLHLHWGKKQVGASWGNFYPIPKSYKYYLKAIRKF